VDARRAIATRGKRAVVFMAGKFISIREWLANEVEMEMRVVLAESSSCLGLAEANFTETPFFMHLSPQYV
jgi:hypothetical protein